MAKVLVFAGAVTSCVSGSGSGGERTDLPTHDHESVGDAALPGILRGTTSCLWVGTPGSQRTPLVFPSGYTAEKRGEEIVLIGPDGRDVAAVGDAVEVEGDFDDGTSGCLDAAEPGAWLVDAVEPCDDCDEELE